MKKIQHIKKWLHDAVSDIEFLHNEFSGKRTETDQTREAVNFTINKYFPFKGEFRPEFRRLFLESIHRHRPALWFLHNLDAAKVVRSLVLDLAEVPFESLIEGKCQDDDLRKLLAAASEIHRSEILIYPWVKVEQFEHAIETLAALDSSCCLVCDWAMEDDEITKARGLVAGSKMDLILTEDSN